MIELLGISLRLLNFTFKNSLILLVRNSIARVKSACFEPIRCLCELAFFISFISGSTLFHVALMIAN
jgi:hypothetical protein